MFRRKIPSFLKEECVKFTDLMGIYSHIYSNQQRDCFVVSQLFSVARYVGGFKQ